jgi:predicted short-subunit dehydrogenase-like oxidoreductase (DUF2520 family)
MRIHILGAGKVGRALARAIRKAGWPVTLRAARDGVPRRRIEADLLILAVRDKDLLDLAARLAAGRLVGPKTACVHVAGALGPEVLAPLRGASLGVAQMHPMISFASPAFVPPLLRGNMHVRGDPPAARRARALARRLGMTPRTFPRLDAVGYHAAAGLLANGAAALAAVSAEVLARSGVPRSKAAKLLGPLLRSVAENVERLGFPDSLTGPVRRGDAAGVSRHLQAIGQRCPEALPLYRAAGLAQLPLARALSDAPKVAYDAIDDLLRTPPGAPRPKAAGNQGKRRKRGG